MRLPHGVVGVLAGACCAAVIACASARSPSMMGPPATTGTHPQAIVDLDAKIEDARKSLGLPAPVVPLDVTSPTPMSVAPTAATDPSCHPATSTACTDTCKLADSICDDAKKICDLAGQLPDDAWAAGKCTSAEQSCTAAHARCCGCQ